MVRDCPKKKAADEHKKARKEHNKRRESLPQSPKPAAANKNPVVENKNPAVVNKNPAVINKNPAVANTNPAVVNKNPNEGKQSQKRQVKMAKFMLKDKSLTNLVFYYETLEGPKIMGKTEQKIKKKRKNKYRR